MDDAIETDQAVDIDALGPVDYIVVGFPGRRFNGAIAPALAELRNTGVVTSDEFDAQ
jgi:hypothetical protein